MNNKITKLDISLLTKAIDRLSKELGYINHTLSLIDMDQLLDGNEESYKVEEPELKESEENVGDETVYKTWYSKMYPKYQMLKRRLSINSERELYSKLFESFNRQYPEHNLNNIRSEYMEKNNFPTCYTYTLDAIEHTDEVRELFEELVDEWIERSHAKNQ